MINKKVVTKYGTGTIRRVDHDSRFDRKVYYVELPHSNLFTGEEYKLEIVKFFDYEIKVVE